MKFNNSNRVEARPASLYPIEMSNLFDQQDVENWREDFHFGNQRLAGCNPKLLKLCTAIPDKYEPRSTSFFQTTSKTIHNNYFRIYKSETFSKTNFRVIMKISAQKFMLSANTHFDDFTAHFSEAVTFLKLHSLVLYCRLCGGSMLQVWCGCGSSEAIFGGIDPG